VEIRIVTLIFYVVYHNFTIHSDCSFNKKVGDKLSFNCILIVSST